MTEPDRPFEVKVNERTHMVVEAASGRCLGAVGSNFYRCWVFPLYTPAGRTVVREFPFDHPFHNGCFVAQHPVVVGGRTGNLWACPPRRGPDDHLFEHVGRMDAPPRPDRLEPHARGVRFALNITWRDEHDRPLIDEHRTVDLFAAADATVCDLFSTKTAAYGPAEFPRSKFGAIGIRAEPRLLPALGGQILADAGRTGRAEIVHEGESDFVAYQSGPGGGEPFGVLMHILAPRARGPWFIRDYGMALYNPTWTQTIRVQEGQSWTVGLRIAAYDGALTEGRARAWLREEVRT